MTAAVAAVALFFETDSTFDKNPAERAAYVAWAFPDNPDDPIPGTWLEVDDNDDNPEKHVRYCIPQSTTYP